MAFLSPTPCMAFASVDCTVLGTGLPLCTTQHSEALILAGATGRCWKRDTGLLSNQDAPSSARTHLLGPRVTRRPSCCLGRAGPCPATAQLWGSDDPPLREKEGARPRRHRRVD